MGNKSSTGSNSNKEAISLPIDTIFKLPSPLPSWPSGGDFAGGEIDLGGLQVRQVSSFNKVWATYEGGPDNLGATVFEPSDVPDGFSMFGCYAQPNNQPLFGWVLVGKDDSGQNNQAYFWLPTPPDGYAAVGLVITTSPDKPSLEKIRCVRADFSDECETENMIWTQATVESDIGVNIYGLRPKNRGIQAQALSVGTFTIQDNDSSSLSLSCLKNNKFPSSSMPNLKQVEALFEAYSPLIYFHPKEIYLPSSVNWYFNNGALLYTKGEESNPVPIEPNGSNLPQGSSNDKTYWLDLPVDENAKEKVKKGDLASSEVYLHVKPMFGSTFTDIAMWIFYPFNGHTTAKLGLIDFSLGHIGEHVGDWEHLTLRISNFDGVLYKVYFAEHSTGTWIDTSMVEFHSGNKIVAYSSLNGHPFYSKPGLVLQGSDDIGIRNDTAKSDVFMDTGAGFSIVAADNLVPAVVEPPWLNYDQEWGPKTLTKVGDEVKWLENSLSGDFKSAFEKVVNLLPIEIYEEKGPLGPKMKSSWNGDEK
ncbi:Plant protein of unknown function (DUF946) [Abeliophyllum distichum]|uniref:Vacuolar protein sorting-associated protein 62 n=1 Tax=Abeliophyllum distichum TaxID=126358 RepID=A0ABD1TX21_9LAMI